MSKKTSGTLYLLHFARPYKHARHYLGFTRFANVQQRVRQHQSGKGANLTRHVHSALIEMYLAWQGQGTRSDERRLKTQSHVSRWCPICIAAHAAARNQVGRRKAVQP
jgi:predicted GIY-YIG superfamily endonuclease